jgi:ethanolamine utilization protein EutN
MQVCRVVGSVTATAKDERLVGLKLMLVRAADSGEDTPSFVAVDTVGAGIGERVLVVFGSAARLATATRDTPTDAAIVAIIDPERQPKDE